MKLSFRRYMVGWYDIDLKLVGKLSVLKRPNSFFYKNFYEILFKKYSLYSDVDSKLILNKLYVKDLIKDQINIYKPEKVLSFASGIGYVEYLLLSDRAISDSDLFMYDWSNNSFKIFDNYGFHSKKIFGTFNSDVLNQENIGLVYFIQFFYALNNLELNRAY